MNSPLREPPPRRKKQVAISEPNLGPRRVFRRLAHSLSQERNRDSKTRQGLTYNIPYNYRKHEAHLRRHQANTETRRVVSSGPHEEGVGPSPPPQSWMSGLDLDAQKARSQSQRFEITERLSIVSFTYCVTVLFLRCGIYLY